MLVHCRVTPSIKFTGTHLYTWVERGTVSKVSCPRTQHNVPGQDSNPESSALTMRPPRLPTTLSSQSNWRSHYNVRVIIPPGVAPWLVAKRVWRSFKPNALRLSNCFKTIDSLAIVHVQLILTLTSKFYRTFRWPLRQFLKTQTANFVLCSQLHLMQGIYTVKET